ncbi:glycosyltransferase [Variovorax beijingensis]|uniref:glycosyltransferase n=1 Tax=Variovorax beijingensis TaxID=2496117 RepID=UPI003F6A46D2
MRILLVAYEFPPSPSPQSLRWAYLVRELSARGHAVHVLAPDLPGDAFGLPDSAAVMVHRTNAGPIIGFIAARSRRPEARRGLDDTCTWQPAGPSKPKPHLNWKGKLFQHIKGVAGYTTFPDIRGEWKPDDALDELVASLRPDVVVCSHEPASTLRLGRQLRGRVAWVVDLGDPVLAPYTPWRWRRRARALEREVWRGADGVTVTTQATASLLASRHGTPFGQCTVVPQGYDDGQRAPAPWCGDFFDQSLLEVVYTGSFYGFRDPTAVISGLLRTQGVRLTVASMSVPPTLLALAREHPQYLRLLGFLPHDQALTLQSGADLVLNIANEDPVQVPGKLFEYLGSGRPILHVGQPTDQVADLLQRAGVGWVCENSPDAVAGMLATLRDDRRAGRLGDGLDRDPALLSCYRWTRLAQDYESVLELACQRFDSGAGKAPPLAQPEPANP